MKNRTYPQHPLESASVVSQAIQDELAGRPMKRLLVAHALGMKPASTNFTSILSSSRAYGLTEGTEKADVVSLTPLGHAITAGTPNMAARKEAVLTPPTFGAFFRAYDNAKLPSEEMLKKLLVSDFAVPAERAEECAGLIRMNGEYAGLIRSISGSLHVILDGPDSEAHLPGDVNDSEDLLSDVGETEADLHELQTTPAATPLPSASTSPKPIFVGHGKNKGPLTKVVKVLDQFKIPHRVAETEPMLGRPIPTKVKQTMEECGSAILIFTKDEKLFDEDGNDVWRPSENVVHELGAASFAYDDRIVIFKETGITLPSNFSSIGYIEFDPDAIEARTPELLQELIHFGLVRITPAA